MAEYKLMYMKQLKLVTRAALPSLLSKSAHLFRWTPFGGELT